MIKLVDGMYQDYRNNSIYTWSKCIDAMGVYTRDMFFDRRDYRNTGDRCFLTSATSNVGVKPTKIFNGFTNPIGLLYDYYDGLDEFPSWRTTPNAFARSLYATNHKELYAETVPNILLESIACNEFTIGEPGYLTVYLDNVQTTEHATSFGEYITMRIPNQIVPDWMFDADGAFAQHEGVYREMNGNFGLITNIGNLEDPSSMATDIIKMVMFELFTDYSTKTHTEFTPHLADFYKLSAVPRCRKLVPVLAGMSNYRETAPSILNLNFNEITFHFNSLGVVLPEIIVNGMVFNTIYGIDTNLPNSIHALGGFRISGVRFDREPPATKNKTQSDFEEGETVENNQIVSRIIYDMTKQNEYVLDFSGKRQRLATNYYFSELVIDNRDNNFAVYLNGDIIPANGMIKINPQRVYRLKGSGKVRVTAYEIKSNQQIEAF